MTPLSAFPDKSRGISFSNRFPQWLKYCIFNTVLEMRKKKKMEQFLENLFFSGKLLVLFWANFVPADLPLSRPSSSFLVWKSPLQRACQGHLCSLSASTLVSWIWSTWEVATWPSHPITFLSLNWWHVEFCTPVNGASYGSPFLANMCSPGLCRSGAGQAEHIL